MKIKFNWGGNDFPGPPALDTILNHQFIQKLMLVVERKFNYISPTDNTKLLSIEMFSSIPHQRFLVQPRLENLLESHHLWAPK